MKIKLLIVFFFCFNTILFAQIDGSEKIRKIKSIDTSSTSDTKLPLKLTPLQTFRDKPNRPSLNYTPLTDHFKPTSGVDMTAKSNLIAPTWEIKQKFSEGQRDLSKFDKDYYLGDLKTNSKFVRIKCRDHEYVDGDRIKLYLNKAVIHPNITLTGAYYIIDIELNEGENIIEFEALNEGLSSPNTAELKVLDQNNAIISSNQWLINTGYKARLIIMKQ